MLTFHINLRSAETKRGAARGVLLLLALVFGLKKDGFAWECPQKVKKTSSDMLGFEKCAVKTYIFAHGVQKGEF